MRVLVMTAVVEEAEAVLRGLDGLPGDATTAVHAPIGPFHDGWLLTRPWGEIQLLVGGVGPAAAAAATAVAIVRGGPFDLVVDLGVAGGFPGRADPGAAVLAHGVVAADLGAELPPSSPDGPAGFAGLDTMGFGNVRFDLNRTLVARAADAVAQAWPDTRVGTVLTVSTVTGTPESTQRLADAHPDALAEAMEGFAVVTAAAPWDLPVLELRTICNPVGVSDRSQWDLPGAFAALEVASAALLADAHALLDGAP